QRTSAPGATHVSLDGHGHVWVGAYPSGVFDVLDATNGAVQRTLSLANGGFRGSIDAQGGLWASSPSPPSLLRYDTVASSTMNIAVLQSSGVTLASDGSTWNSMGSNNTVTKLGPNGIVQPGFPVPSFGNGALGIAIGPDGDVWVANTNTSAVSRLSPTGALRKRITVSGLPNGLCFDSQNKLWVTAQSQNAALRIDPAAGTDHLGAVDLTVALGTGAGPQSFGAMSTQLTVA